MLVESLAVLPLCTNYQSKDLCVFWLILEGDHTENVTFGSRHATEFFKSDKYMAKKGQNKNGQGTVQIRRRLIWLHLLLHFKMV